jgi:hypothetical protein
VTEPDLNRRLAGCRFLSSDPIQAPPPSRCRDMVRLHFVECSRITEIWSEVDAASRRQQLTRRPAGRSQRDRHLSLTARVVCEK